MFINKLLMDTDFEFGVRSAFADAAAPVRAMPSSDPLGDRYDFDGDGTNELLASNTFNFFNNNGKASIGMFDLPSGAWKGIVTVDFGWIVSGTADFDGDGSMDLIMYKLDSGAYGRFDLENGVNQGWEGLGTSSWVPLTHADLNGDGILDEPFRLGDDFISGGSSSGTVKIGYFQKDAQGGKAWKGLVSYADNWYNPTLADFNADGIWDMMMVNENSGVIGQFRLGGGNAAWSKITTMGAGYETYSSGDINNDGYHDIVAYNPTNNRIGYYDMAGGTPSWVGLGTYGQGWEVEDFVDLNNDGRADVLWQNIDTGRVGMWEVDGASKSWTSLALLGEGWGLG